MADEEKTPPKGDNPLTKLFDFAKDVPWYYWLGGALAAGAIGFGVYQSRQQTISTDTGIPQAYTTSPLDFATQDSSGGGGVGLPGSSPTPPMPTPTPTPISGTPYTVQPGDTLDKIAKKYNVPGGWGALYETNKQVIDAAVAHAGEHVNDPWDHIFVGEKLTLPI